MDDCNLKEKGSGRRMTDDDTMSPEDAIDRYFPSLSYAGKEDLASLFNSRRDDITFDELLTIMTALDFNDGIIGKIEIKTGGSGYWPFRVIKRSVVKDGKISSVIEFQGRWHD